VDNLLVEQLRSRKVILIKKTELGMSETTSTGEQLFEIARFQVLAAAHTSGAKDALPNAYIYAWENRIYPSFIQTPGLHQKFAGYFDVTEEMIDELSDLLDRRWRAKNTPTFYELEDHFNARRGSERWDRSALIRTCRYMFLSELFDQAFWGTLLTPMEHPSEAGGITRHYIIENIV
jgi:antitoxin MazE